MNLPTVNQLDHFVLTAANEHSCLQHEYCTLESAIDKIKELLLLNYGNISITHKATMMAHYEKPLTIA